MEDKKDKFHAEQNA